MKFRLLPLVLVLIPLWGCQTTVFGVPEDRWNELSQSERAAVIDAYNERQRLREETNRANAEARLAEAQRVEDIHRGSGGYFGDLIRVVFHDGTMSIRGKRHGFQPFAVELADGETALVKVYREKKSHVFDTLHIAYEDRVLLIESNAGSRALRLPFKPGWQRGKCYPRVDSRGTMKLRDVQVFVEVIPYSRASSDGSYVRRGRQFASYGCGGGAQATAPAQPAQPAQGGQQPQVIIVPVPAQQQQQQQQVIIVPGQPAQPVQSAQPAQPAQPVQPAQAAQQPQASQPAADQPQAGQAASENPRAGGLEQLVDGDGDEAEPASNRKVACLMPGRNEERGSGKETTVRIPLQACLNAGGSVVKQ